MRELPLPFTSTMVRATLLERDPKTETRRLVRVQPGPDEEIRVVAKTQVSPNYYVPSMWALFKKGEKHPVRDFRAIHSPYGLPGDRLWVREAWRAAKYFDDSPPRDLSTGFVVIRYEADLSYKVNGTWLDQPGKYRPPMFMPRWASRIRLEVLEVRIERLQCITEADAKAEGVLTWAAELAQDPKRTLADIEAMANKYGTGSLRGGYAALFEEINGPGTWAANPYVWVVVFKRLEP